MMSLKSPNYSAWRRKRLKDCYVDEEQWSDAVLKDKAKSNRGKATGKTSYLKNLRAKAKLLSKTESCQQIATSQEGIQRESFS